RRVINMGEGKSGLAGGIAVIVTAAIIAGGFALTKTVDSHSANRSSSSVTQSQNQTQGFTITDSTGQVVTFKQAPQRIVCLDADAYNLINMLGGSSKVVGVSKMMSQTTPSAKGKAIAGTWQDPNVTEILSLKADVVFAYAQYTNAKAVKELQAAGIPVVYVNGDNIATLKNDVTAVGKIVGNEKQATKFNDFATKYLNLVQDRIAKVPTNKRVNAYIEEYETDQTAGKGSASEAFLQAAGINNIALNKGQFATVDASWILSQNPDMVIKIEADGMGVLGQGVTSTAKAETAYNSLVGRSGWSDLSAVKNGNVHLMDSNLVLSDTDVIPGILYAAKWAYPDQFKDINPAHVQQEMQKEFFGGAQQGTYVYSGTTSNSNK
ncbi:MAG: ABC transporter substrate-binding protein, partial [Sarcina sp.]